MDAMTSSQTEELLAAGNPLTLDSLAPHTSVKLTFLKREIHMDTGVAGMWQVMTAMIMNVDAIQDFMAQGMLPLSQLASELNYQMAGDGKGSGWIAVMNNAVSQIQTCANNKDSNGVTKWMGAFTQDNTIFNQSTAFWNNLVSSQDRTSSDTSQTVGLNFQMIQSGPLAQFAIWAQVV